MKTTALPLNPVSSLRLSLGRSRTQIQPHALSIAFETRLPITVSHTHVLSCVAAVRVPLWRIGSPECQTMTEHCFA